MSAYSGGVGVGQFVPARRGCSTSLGDCTVPPPLLTPGAPSTSDDVGIPRSDDAGILQRKQMWSVKRYPTTLRTLACGRSARPHLH